MANFLDRIMCSNNYLDEGGMIDCLVFGVQLRWWASGSLPAATIKTYWGMNTSQSNQLDAILATRPIAPLLLLNVPAYVTWSDKISGVLYGAQNAWTGLISAAQVESALGI